jgi:hypothetical protein
MLLHMIPASAEVNFLPDASARIQGLRGVINTSESLTLNRIHGDRFHRWTGYRGYSAMIRGLAAAWSVSSLYVTCGRRNTFREQH